MDQHPCPSFTGKALKKNISYSSKLLIFCRGAPQHTCVSFATPLKAKMGQSERNAGKGYSDGQVLWGAFRGRD